MGVRRKTLPLFAGLCLAAVGLVAVAWPRPPAYPQSDQLVILWNRLQSYEIPKLWISEPEYSDYRQQSRSFQDLAAYAVTSYQVGTTRPDQRLAGRKVTASLFPLLGIQPLLGRTILPEEDIPGAHPVAVISHALWQRHFNADPQVIGQSLHLDLEPHTIVGVMPEDFAFPSPEVQLWTPLHLDTKRPADRQSHYLTVLGRLRPNLGIEDAQSEISRLVDRWSLRHYRNAGWQVLLEPLVESCNLRSGHDPGLQPLHSMDLDQPPRTRTRTSPLEALSPDTSLPRPQAIPWNAPRLALPRVNA